MTKPTWNYYSRKFHLRPCHISYGVAGIDKTFLNFELAVPWTVLKKNLFVAIIKRRGELISFWFEKFEEKAEFRQDWVFFSSLKSFASCPFLMKLR